MKNLRTHFQSSQTIYFLYHSCLMSRNSVVLVVVHTSSPFLLESSGDAPGSLPTSVHHCHIYSIIRRLDRSNEARTVLSSFI
jgi:hypothetical protein